MTTVTPPGRRGAARRARTDRRLADAVADQLDRHGYAGLTIERVAATSGVAKTTIYRRWGSKAEMVFDLMIHRAELAPVADTGTLPGDVRALAGRAAAVVAGNPGRSVLPGLLADMTSDAALATRLRQEFVRPARTEIVTVLDRAVERGEIAALPDVDAFHAALLGIPYTRVHLLAEPGDDRLVESVTSQLLALLHSPSAR